MKKKVFNLDNFILLLLDKFSIVSYLISTYQNEGKMYAFVSHKYLDTLTPKVDIIFS